MASKHAFFPSYCLLQRHYLMLHHCRARPYLKICRKSLPRASLSTANQAGTPSSHDEVTASSSSSHDSTTSRQKASSNFKRSKQNTTSGKYPPVKDWREWFRSQDYDDPWSPYYAFQHATGGSPATSSQAIPNHDELFKTIMDGTWKRRRHGMNLEPLTIKFAGDKGGGSSVTDTENSTFNPATTKRDGSYVSKSDDQNSEWIKSNNKLLGLDRQSRFVCGMFDDLYRTGIRRQVDRPRTARCHRLIGQLLTLTPKPHAPTSERRLEIGQSDIQINGLAQRANAILERMELCSPMALDWKRSRRLIQKPKFNNSIDNNNIEHSEDGDSNGLDPVAESERLLSILMEPPSKTYLELHDNNDPFHQYQYPKHLENTKHESPAPTRKIYTMVLLSFAKESGPIHVAQQAEDVVWSMIVRANQLLKFDQSLEMSERSDNIEQLPLENLNPSAEHWNCVLQCWSISTDRDRGFHAYSFLISWLEWNKRCEAGESSLKVSAPDMTSYHSVLWACVQESRASDENDKIEDARAREMGSGVAIRLWRGVEKSNLSPDAASYSLFLRAICQTSELPSKSSSCKALVALARVFRRCCDDGMVSLNVVEIVRGATTESQLKKLVGKNMALVDDGGKPLPTANILLRLPAEWTVNT